MKIIPPTKYKILIFIYTCIYMYISQEKDNGYQLFVYFILYKDRPHFLEFLDVK